MQTRLVSAILSVPLILASPAPAVAAPLQPKKPWVLDYSDTQCVASRDYADAAGPFSFLILPSPSGETYELLLARKHSGPALADESEGTVIFDAGRPIKAWMLHYGARSAKVEFYTFRIKAEEMAQARAARAVTLRSGSRPNVTFALSNMPALLKGLEDCTADLKMYWHMNGKEIGTIAGPS